MATGASEDGGGWTDSSNCPSDISPPTSEDEFGYVRSPKAKSSKSNTKKLSDISNTLKKSDSGNQTLITGPVCYRSYYTGKSVVNHVETNKTIRVDPISCAHRIVQDVSCQTKSTGLIIGKEEVDTFDGIPPTKATKKKVKKNKKSKKESRPKSVSTGKPIVGNYISIDRSALIAVITDVINTLEREKLVALTLIIREMLESDESQIVNCVVDGNKLHLVFNNATVDIDLSKVYVPEDLEKIFDKSRYTVTKQVSSVGCNTDPELVCSKITLNPTVMPFCPVVYIPAPFEFCHWRSSIPRFLVHQSTQTDDILVDLSEEPLTFTFSPLQLLLFTMITPYIPTVLRLLFR